MSDALSEVTAALQRSLILRLFLILFLALVLLIPIVMIGGLVGERQMRRDAATAEVSAKWGSRQVIVGPALVIPVVRRWTEAAQPKPIERSEERNVVFLPDTLRVTGTLQSETLSRGIFLVPVYRMKLTLEGSFKPPQPADLGIAAADVHWDRAHLAIGVSEPQAIQDQVSVTWNGHPVTFEPGPGGFTEAVSGIQAPVPVKDAPAYVFSMPLNLKGSQSAFFSPSAADTSVELSSNFPHPNFQGAWLPSSRTVSLDGFRASWSVPYLGRGYPQSWLSSGAGPSDAMQKARFGVELQDPIDPYRMAERSVKYAGLFILLTFTSVWLVEVMAGLRVHPVQYLLLGAALCVFYLLELSLSEHIRFVAAYGTASLAVIGMVAAYSVVALKRARRGAVVGVGVSLLYGYLYVLLTNEDYALLIGSIGLFVALGLVMLVTRRIDWYSVGAPQRPAREA